MNPYFYNMLYLMQFSILSHGRNELLVVRSPKFFCLNDGVLYGFKRQEEEISTAHRD